MCIYLKNHSDTTKSEEHIFPACIGGIRKLSNSEISAKANELFKPLEDDFAHKSEIQLTRSFYGPGKRGGKKRNSAHIMVMYDANQNRNELGYLFLGKAYTIPQILIEEATGKFSLTSMDADIAVAEKTSKDLLDTLSEFDIFTQSYVYLQINTPGSHPDIIIGKQDKKIIIASHCLKEEVDLFKVDRIVKSLKTAQCTGESMGKFENPKIEIHAELSENTNRVFAKTAFNCLCYLKGVDFVNNENFDNFRNWIVTGEGHSENWINEDIIATPDIVDIMPTHAHWCLFTVVNQKVCAVVCFYGHWTRKFELGMLPEGQQLPLLGYICDFQNHEEYSLPEYISYVAQENHKRLEANEEM